MDSAAGSETGEIADKLNTSAKKRNMLNVVKLIKKLEDSFFILKTGDRKISGYIIWI